MAARTAQGSDSSTPATSVTTVAAGMLDFRDGGLVDDQDAAEALAGQPSAGDPAADGARCDLQPLRSGSGRHELLCPHGDDGPGAGGSLGRIATEADRK